VTDAADTIDLRQGDVVWAVPDPAVGREQAGRRPAVVVASDDYLEQVTRLAVVVPVTRTDRGWPNHVTLTGDTGLPADSFAMTEQIRTIDRRRVQRVTGRVDTDTQAAINQWLGDFLGIGR